MSKPLEIVLHNDVKCYTIIDILLSEGIAFEHKHENGLTSFVCQDLDGEQVMYKLVALRVPFKYLDTNNSVWLHILPKKES